MTSPINSYHTNFGRFYEHPKVAAGTHTPSGDYSPRPSITNIIGMLDKKFLPPYYAKLVAEYAVDHLDNISNLIENFGRDVAVGTLKAIPSQPSKAQQVGDEVHAAIDALVSGEPAPRLLNTTSVNMFAQVEHFFSTYEVEIVRSEYTVWSYEHGYAGTGDLLWYREGRLCVVDAKTGTNVHPEVAMQTAAIANADVILDPSGEEIPIDFEAGLFALHVRPRSVKLYELQNVDKAWEAFLACRRLFEWQYRDRETVFGEPLKTERPK